MAVGWERLKAELIGGEANGGDAAFGACAGAAGMERSSRSFMPDGAGAAGFDGAGDEKALKSARPLEGLVVLFCCWVCGVGFELKKLPPPPNMPEEDVDGGDFALEKLSSPANGDGFGAGAALKDRLLNASFIPPNDDC